MLENTIKVSNDIIYLIDEINLRDAIIHRKYDDWPELSEAIAEQIYIDLCKELGETTKHELETFLDYESAISWYLCFDSEPKLKHATVSDFFTKVHNLLDNKNYIKYDHDAE